MSIVITILIFRMNWEWIFFNLLPDYRDSQVILLITYCWSSEYIRNSCLEYNPKTQYFIFLKIITIIQSAREMMDSGLTVPSSKELRLFVKQRPSCNSLSLNPISPDVTGASSSLPLPLRVPRVSIIHGEPTAAHWIDLRALYTGSRVENSPGSITEQVVTTMLVSRNFDIRRWKMSPRSSWRDAYRFEMLNFWNDFTFFFIFHRYRRGTKLRGFIYQ